MIKTLTIQTITFIIALSFILIVTVLAGASPFEVFANLWQGAFGTADQFARVLATWAPLLLCSCGLVFTFTAGLYNLGIEGQITIGAIVTTFALQSLQNSLPHPLVIVIGLIAGIIGGVVWGLGAAFLNIYGRINEIFAGLGLNFVAQGLALYLIFGPWKRPGIASMSGTEPFPETLWLPMIGRTEASPIAITIAVIGVILTVLVMRGTYLGLRLRAVGQNLRAAYVLGIPSVQRLMGAFALCGGLAGLAGALQVLAVFHRLIPNISSNLGFLALLVVMLVNFDALLSVPVAFFFSALNIGGLQLPLSLQLESSLAGVIQATLVFFALLGRGLEAHWPRWFPKSGS